ncbi:CCHC-type domain-containing protein [Durusdinium trenchii]|uniref:CCHC-type domain-containing protein n=1 Tax=Durusdinium trenchii TaxID=1381693 RepID=A0ABP0L2U1_9DINO
MVATSRASIIPAGDAMTAWATVTFESALMLHKAVGRILTPCYSYVTMASLLSNAALVGDKEAAEALAEALAMGLTVGLGGCVLRWHYNRGDSSLTSCRDALCVFDGRHGAYDREAVGRVAKLKEADQKWCCQSYTPYKDICVDGTTTLERFESSNALRTLMPSDGDFFGVYDGTKRTMEGANKGRFLSFVAQRRVNERRHCGPTPPRCTALVPLSPPLQLSKVLRMPKKRLRKKQKAEMTEVAITLSQLTGECTADVFQVFSTFEASGAAEPLGALARLRAGAERYGAILCSGDCRSSFILVDGCLDLLATAADEAGGSAELLSWLLQRLGGEAKALRDRAARQRAASLLWRLLPDEPSKVSRLILGAAEMALLDLAKDKTPAIRLAATRGLQKLPGAETKAALVQLTLDLTPAVRGAALLALGGSGRLWEASGRALDAAPRVRARFYEAALQEEDLPPELVQIGLADANSEVRSACMSWIKAWSAKQAAPDAALRALLAAAGESHAEKALKALLARELRGRRRVQLVAQFFVLVPG